MVRSAYAGPCTTISATLRFRLVTRPAVQHHRATCAKNALGGVQGNHSILLGALDQGSLRSRSCAPCQMRVKGQYAFRVVRLELWSVVLKLVEA